MISQTIPSEINYKSIIPKGYPSVYKQWDLDPLTNNKQWANNDIVRFNFQNMGSGVFDPYRSYIEITVSTNANDHPVGLLQVDNSAQSFINQTVLYSKNRQIQRITQYSVLAAYLSDIGLTQYICQGRDAQGYGYGSFDTMPFNKPNQNNYGITRNAVSDGGQNQTITSYQTYGNGTIFPTIGNQYPFQVSNTNDSRIVNAARIAKGHYTNANIVMHANQKDNLASDDLVIQSAMNALGYAQNIRTQYQTNFVLPKFPQSTSSIPNYQLQVDRSVSNTSFPFYFDQTKPYYVTTRSSITTSLPPSGSTQTHTINCSNFGFTSLFTPFFTRGTFQPFISATVPQCSILNGQITPTKFPVYQKKFKIPLISGVMGVLIQKQQFILIPLQSINDCLLEITLDPYAMFTSGYCDVSEVDDVGCLIQQKRDYQIQRIKYKFQTYHFIDQQMNFLIQSSLTRQIIITSPFWQLGNQYQIPGGTPVNNNYIVGITSTHLNEIVCLFVSNDYQIYSFARKHYRLSNNVKRFWSKIGVEYWPPQPYKGNGGNIMSNNQQDDNSNFVENIYWSNGFMFAKTPLPRINPYNFSVNQRPYDVTNKNSYYDISMMNNPSYKFGAKSINSDTGLGMAWLHENRVVGRAAYVISYTPFCNNDFILQGINLSGINNYQVLFEQDTSMSYQRDQTLYVFGKSSVIVKYTLNGIQTFGR